MAIYFKFKSRKDFDFVSIDGDFISIGDLKAKLLEKMSLRDVGDVNEKNVRNKAMRRGDDLVISNFEMTEDYLDDSFMVPKYSSVLVRRRPLVCTPIVLTDEQKPALKVRRPPLACLPIVLADEPKPALEVPPVYSPVKTFESLQTSTSHIDTPVKTSESLQKNSSYSFASDEVDEFGFDMYAVPEVVPAPIPSPSEENEKVRDFVETSANQGKKQLEGSPERWNGQRSESGRVLHNAAPYQRYVCHRCGVPGHFIRYCPTNGNPEFDIKNVRPPTGIPKAMLIPDTKGAYFLSTGQSATLKPNEASFEREVDFLPSVGRKNVDVPPELCCPLCKDVLKDAVLVSKCCFMSYCDKCIREHISLKAKCVCGARILADDLIPNVTLRDATRSLMEFPGAFSTSSGNVSTITSSGNAGPQASAVVPNCKSPDSKKPVAGAITQGQKPLLSLVLKRSTRQDVETGGTSESQLRESMNNMGEILSPTRPPNRDGKRKDVFNSNTTLGLGDKRQRTGTMSMESSQTTLGSKTEEQEKV